MYTDIVCDLIIIMAKYYIYRCKVKQIEICINVFIKEIYQRYCIEKKLEKCSNNFRNNWESYMNIFKSLQTAPY